MSLEAQITALVAAANNLTGSVNGKVGQIDASLAAALSQFNVWKENFSTTLNGLEVYKQGGIKRFFFGQFLDSGGHKASGDGPDASFPYCTNPRAPYYINLLEFTGSNGNFGAEGDVFRGDFIMSHRGISSGSYLDQLFFRGTSWSDSVSGHVEIRNIAHDGAVSLHISEPSGIETVIPLTKAMQGTIIPVNFYTFGQGASGKARITIKVDTRYHCGSNRSFSADVSFTSNKAAPAVARVSQVKPAWNA